MTRTVDRCRYYMGGYWVFLVTGADTEGRYALMEVNVRKGLEPPPHVHQHEDEMYYLLEGEMLFAAGETEQVLKAGDFIYLPKGIPHYWKLQSDTARFLLQVSPAGLEEMFLGLSRPADQLDYPPAPTGPPSAELLQKIGALQKKYGIAGIDNSRIKTV
ncbi:MAG: cupin domain-containing protein [Chitinophagaceae bacterium]